MTDPEVAKLADLVAYQEGSVVSRQLIRKESGNVTLFAFDEGEQLTEHTSPFEALVFILDGEARIEIAGKPFDLKRDEMILLPAGKPHAVKAPKRFKMCLTMIRS